jgi:DNA-binding SARP family transcriptional activator
VLGPLRVQRVDGSAVDPAEFRTAKTRHLLRLLALADGAPVAVDQLVDTLWPSVTEQRGRASLRTAASQVRHTMRNDHVRRWGDTLQLVDVSVDVHRFAAHSRRARAAAGLGDLAQALAASLDALAEYGGDLAADEPFLDPLLDAQRTWSSHRRDVLLSAASAACTVGRAELARELAEQALLEDATCERAARLAMRAYMHLGETGAAIRCYEQLRSCLAEEFSIAPSAPTQTLYDRLLGDPVGLAAS